MIVDDRQLLYLHPTKTGGTSVEVALLQGKGNSITPAQQRKYAIWENDNQHWPLAKMLRHYPRAAKYERLVTVRHPYTRAISEFQYQCAGHRRKRKEFERFYKERNINDAITSGALWACGWPWHDANQSLYADDSCTVLKLEEFPTEWSRLFPDLELPHHQHHQWAAPLTVADLDKSAKHAIIERWGSDFHLFNYEP